MYFFCLKIIEAYIITDQRLKPISIVNDKKYVGNANSILLWGSSF